MKRTDGKPDTRSPLSLVISVCACAVLLVPVALSEASAANPLKDFVKAMVRNDLFGMKAVVRRDQKDMVIIFFALLNETSDELNKGTGKVEEVRRIQLAIRTAARLADAFDGAYPGKDILYGHFQDSQAMLTARVRAAVGSDRTLATFLSACATRVGTDADRRTTASDLASIVQAVTETPEAQAKRLLRERLARIRREQAERAERERIAKFRAKVAALQGGNDVAKLLQLLADDSLDARLKRIVIAALGDLRAREALDELVKLVNNDALKREAVGAMVKIGDDRAIPVFFGLLNDDAVCATVARALSQTGRTDVIARLYAFVNSNKAGFRQKKAVASVLSQRAQTFAKQVQLLQQAKDLTSLVRLLRAQAGIPKHQCIVIRALGAFPDPLATGELLSHLNEPPLQASVIEALGRIGGSRAEQAIIEKVGDESVGDVAAAALRVAWGNQAGAGFVRLLRDPSLGPAQHLRVIRTLGKLRCSESVDDLIDCTDDAKLKGAALVTLGQIGGRRATSELVRKLDDESVGEDAKRALCAIGRPAVPALLVRLRDPKRSAGMKRACQALRTMGYTARSWTERAGMLLAEGEALETLKLGPTVLPMVVGAIGSDDPGIRMAAMEVLGADVGIAAFALLVLTVTLRRKWIWPKIKMELAAGEYEQLRHSMAVGRDESNADPGTILETVWARGRLGRPKRIKLEVFVGEDEEVSSGELAGAESEWASLYQRSILVDDDDMDGLLRSLRKAKEQKRPSPGEKRRDVFVSVGRSVRPGTYLAKTRRGGVRIKVSPPEAD